MEQWEYLDIFCTGDTWQDSQGREGKMPGGMFASEIANIRGQEGWELCGVDSRPRGSAYRLFFKRPLGKK